MFRTSSSRSAITSLLEFIARRRHPRNSFSHFPNFLFPSLLPIFPSSFLHQALGVPAFCLLSLDSHSVKRWVNIYVLHPCFNTCPTLFNPYLFSSTYNFVISDRSRGPFTFRGLLDDISFRSMCLMRSQFSAPGVITETAVWLHTGFFNGRDSLLSKLSESLSNKAEIIIITAPIFFPWFGST